MTLQENFTAVNLINAIQIDTIISQKGYFMRVVHFTTPNVIFKK